MVKKFAAAGLLLQSAKNIVIILEKILIFCLKQKKNQPTKRDKKTALQRRAGMKNQRMQLLHGSDFPAALASDIDPERIVLERAKDRHPLVE